LRFFWAGEGKPLLPPLQTRRFSSEASCSASNGLTMTPEKPYWRETGDHLVGFLRELPLGELPGEGGNRAGTGCRL
jgi:hypothetical protein